MEVQQCQRTFFISHAHFCNRTLVAASVWKPHPCFVCVYMYKIQACIEPRPLIDWLLLHAPEVLCTHNMLIAQILMRTSVLAIRVKSGSDPDCFPGHRVIQVSSCDPVSTLLWTNHISDFSTQLGMNLNIRDIFEKFPEPLIFFLVASGAIIL